MVWKVVVVLSVALCAQGEEGAISEQRVVIHHKKSIGSGEANKSGNQDEYAQAYPSYEFSYNVNDPKTHDIKGQHETREGDEVTGNYWLIEPSGRKRTVNYQANDDSGFNAQIAYTASLKEEENDEDISVSQGENTEKDNIEENNDEGMEINVGEKIQDTEDSNVENGDNREPAPVEENNVSEQNELDDEKDTANNINNINRNDDANVAQSIQIVKNNSNRDNNERTLSKSHRENNDTEKSKRENSKRNNNHDQIRYSNESIKNNGGGSKNSKRVKQDDLKQSNNNIRKAHKETETNRDRHTRNQENIYSDDSNVTVNKGQIGQNVRKQHGFRKGEKYNNNEDSDSQNNKNYAYTNFTPNDEIHRKIDTPNSEETFEHRIRIYHPKNISPTSKKGHRKD